MIRVCRNLAALCFLLAVAGAPAKAIGMQEATCMVKNYYCDDECVDFRGCLESCSWLADHCTSYCGGTPVNFECTEDLEETSTGVCDCVPFYYNTP